nr:AAA domain-containing protein [uncultured Enterobacter sp.]
MVAVYIQGKDRTEQLADWSLRYSDSRQELELVCHFKTGKSFYPSYSECRVEPTQIITHARMRKKGHSELQHIERAEIVGNKYALIYYPGGTRCYVMKAENVQIFAETTLKDGKVFDYFREVAQMRVNIAAEDKKPIAENICRQLDKIIADPDIALHAYCHGTNAERRKPAHFIYPFGLNESQLKSVETAFSAQLSVIEGPPGTGKTQTILNIIANIVMQNCSVAIVSNNNAAVENVYEKLAKAELGHIVAQLGSGDNREAFFTDPPALPEQAPLPAADLNAITGQVTQLKATLRAQNDAAQLRAEIDELAIEEKYLSQWLKNNDIPAHQDVARYALAPQKITDLMAFLQSLPDARIRLRHRLSLLLNFRIFNTAPLSTPEKRQGMFFALQRHYYALRLQQAREALAENERLLQDNNVADVQASLTERSLSALRAHLQQTITPCNGLTKDNYQDDFPAFLQRYPVIGSSTHSIVNSLAPGALLDYVIIDEASQQDIVPGILALGCARNVIVVGDRKQLAHVPTKTAARAPAAHYDCVTHSLLDSLIALYGEALPLTLLKEHYRCHPKIIQFCNKQFYDNHLIAMTRDNGEAALSLVVTAKGNHARRYTNLRELESFSALAWEASGSRGFIAPYNAQVALSGRTLPTDFVSATVHKFQGRECEEIVFSTVLDKNADADALAFVDNPQLINVAVSRAQKRFTLVTGDAVFDGQNQHIAALIRYMTYYADEGDVHHSPVVSAFDLLYDDYDRSLERLKARLDPADSAFVSEQIATALINDALALPAFNTLVLHKQVPLRQLVTCADDRFTPRQREFMAQGASCDFVLYYRVGKQPLAVIEVDGGSHDRSDQRERDGQKDAILHDCGIALLRLRTHDSAIEAKIATFLTRALQKEASAECAVA